MNTVQELNIYPLKSGRGIPLRSVRLAASGFEWDRHWMAVDASGEFVTQRTHPRLARIEPAIDASTLTLRAQGLSPLQLPLAPGGDPVPVRVWKDRCDALDQGDKAGEWISEVVGDTLRLVRVAPAMQRLANAAYAGAEPVPLAFPDGYPLLVVSRSSLDDLNARMPQPVPMTRFRPNVVIEGLPPFAEDRIDTLSIGSVTLRLVKPCTRCVITSTDQLTGERTTNPLPVLRKFRFNRQLLGLAFGENAVIAAGVGERIEVGAGCVASLRDAPLDLRVVTAQ